jgi:hypothetical protein
MSKLIALMAVVTACVVGGCKSDEGTHMKSTKSSSSDTMMTADACPHCNGMQTATAAGTCPICNRKAVR